MKKWLVDVRCEGCKGLFYRSAPGVIVPDADWPRNGDVVVGYEIPNVPGTAYSRWVIFVSRLSDFSCPCSRLDPIAKWILFANV